MAGVRERWRWMGGLGATRADCVRECRFRAAVTILTKAQGTGRLGAVLFRVARATGTPGVPAFSDEERSALPDALGLSSGECDALEDASRYVFETAAFHGASGTLLAEELLAADVDTDVCAGVRDAWDRAGREVVESLRSKTLGGPAELAGVRMQTVVHLGHHGATLGREGGVLAEFHDVSRATDGTDDILAPATWRSGRDTSDEARAAVAGEPRGSTLHVEFSHDALLDMLVELDHIQRAVDSLSH
jgi:hypothetical protein